MPLHFQLQKMTTIHNSDEAKRLINQVKTPKVLKYNQDVFPIKNIALIDTGEGVLLASDAKEYTLMASTGTSSCLQAYFFNEETRCLLHVNDDFEIEWSEVFNQFKNKTVNFILIGATKMPETSEKSYRNLDAFFNSLCQFLNKNDKINITLVQQQVLADNFTPSMSIFIQCEHIAKLPNPGFDAAGNVYDLTPVRLELVDFPIVCRAKEKKDQEAEQAQASTLRNARKNEGEHRAWLSRHLKLESDKTPVLLLNATTTLAKLERSVVFHKATVAYAKQMQDKQLVDSYCNFMTNNSYKSLDRPEAKAYNRELNNFFRYVIENYSFEATRNEQLVREQPDAPWSPVMMSYKTDYDRSVSAIVDSLKRMITPNAKTI